MADKIHPQAVIGHVHLKVSDLERSEAFYRDVLGYEVTSRYENEAVFLAAGGYHHHIAMNIWDSNGGPAPPQNSTGLYHFAIRLPDRRELARTVRRLMALDVPIDLAEDHGVSESVYLHDPDGIRIEFYRDRDPSEWPRNDDGKLGIYAVPLDLDDLLAEPD